MITALQIEYFSHLRLLRGWLDKTTDRELHKKLDDMGIRTQTF